MPYRRIFFEKHRSYHIVSRAVEERVIFKDENDCWRFIYQVYAANIGKPLFNLWRRDIIKIAQAILQGATIPPKFIIEEHPPLVYILDFALVINHYHFHLIPNLENGVPLYMKKLNGGFAKYFNLKHNRKGSLFGSRYKSIPIKTEFQLHAVSRYISIINPLDVYQPGWRDKRLKNPQKALQFLEEYPFSSFHDKTGKRQSKILAPKEILDKYSLNMKKGEYIQFVKDFLKNKSSSFDQLLE